MREICRKRINAKLMLIVEENNEGFWYRREKKQVGTGTTITTGYTGIFDTAEDAMYMAEGAD